MTNDLYYIVVLPDDTQVHIYSREPLQIEDSIYLPSQDENYVIVNKYHEFLDNDKSKPPITNRVFLYVMYASMEVSK